MDNLENARIAAVRGGIVLSEIEQNLFLAGEGADEFGALLATVFESNTNSLSGMASYQGYHQLTTSHNQVIVVARNLRQLWEGVISRMGSV